MNSLMQTLQSWIEVFKSWEKRKQMFVLGGGLFMFLYLLNAIFVRSAHDEIKTATGKITEMKGQVEDLRSQTQAILNEVQNSVANPNSQRALSYKQQLDELDKKLSAYDQQLISAKEMTNILKSILSRESGLKMISMTSLPSVDIMASVNLPAELKNIPNRSTLYKRGAKLVFSGGYFETIDYLKKLENYGKHIFWDDFSYTVKTYPTAEVSLTVYTLTSEEGWVGG